MKITVDDYLMGREVLYPGECTEVIRSNAAALVDRVNSLLAVLEAENIELDTHPVTHTIISSGWRPTVINRQTKGAAVHSRHMSGEAVDLYDPHGLIDEFLLGQEARALVPLRLWMEHPSATKCWCHVQSVAPRSGNRIFYP